ncbi:hypothetical protein HYT24_01235 [Candidatus Pacearchaeota archaeon]|nr:hypothetical protein [Candidatus Pacearchaeota archaeon]
MGDKKVRIDESVMNKIKVFRKNKQNRIDYPSDKYLVQQAILTLLEKGAKP